MDDTDERYELYWLALGKFIHQFSQTERSMQMLVRHFANLNGTIGRAVFGSLRIDAAKDTINRILDATGDAESRGRLKEPLAQLGEINSLRNNIVHWGAWHDGQEELIVTNDFFAHTPARIRSSRVSHVTLEEMTADLHKIEVHIHYEMAREVLTETLMERVVTPVLQAAWSYKPVPQVPLTKVRLSRPPRVVSPA